MKYLLLSCLAAIMLAPMLSLAADKPAPLKFSYTAFDGSSVNLADMKGKVVIIFFWATWSKPSRDNVKTIVNLRHKYHDQGLEVLGVSLDSDQHQFETFIDEYAMNWPEYFDGLGENNKVAQSMKVKQIPQVWIVGKDGVLIGINPTGNLDTVVEKTLKAK